MADPASSVLVVACAKGGLSAPATGDCTDVKPEPNIDEVDIDGVSPDMVLRLLSEVGAV
jgi:hypothetical protein